MFPPLVFSLLDILIEIWRKKLSPDLTYGGYDLVFLSFFSISPSSLITFDTRQSSFPMTDLTGYFDFVELFMRSKTRGNRFNQSETRWNILSKIPRARHFPRFLSMYVYGLTKEQSVCCLV